MKKLILPFTFVLFSVVLKAQENDPIKHCGADEMRIETLRKNPDIARAVIQREQNLEQFTRVYVSDFYNGQTRSATYTIPVVFHVIHNFGAENISDEQILDGLDVLNKTFRKQLADTGSIVADFKPLHADCDIEFRLARIDPDGNCTSGINRIASYLTNTGDHQVKSLIHWPPDKYLNVYIVIDAAGLAGHCVWPSDADTIPQWDGIVIAHNYVGTMGTSSYTRSVAFAHECGHYLNLHHIWGGNNVPGFYYLPCGDTANCSIGDDFVSDTPPTKGWQTCSLSGASCGNTVDNVQNAMDYSYCNRMFTYGQKARMHACLNSPIAGRNNLWTPANLAATGVFLSPAPLCAADFTSTKTLICENIPNNTVTYTNTSYNGNFTALGWTFPGGSPATSSDSVVTVTYNAAGTYDVSLSVTDGTDTAHITKTNYVTVLASAGTAVYPYTESFESTASLDGPDWFTSDADGTGSWALTNTAAFSGTRSVMLNNFDHPGPGGSKDELIGPVVQLSGAASMRMAFRYAFAPDDSLPNNDRLQLMVTGNCGVSWIQRLNLTGSSLETAPAGSTAFVPSDTSHWKTATAIIPSAYLTDDFRFKFIHTSYGGNNVYIDDINIDILAGTENITGMGATLQVYPNPSAGKISVDFTLDASETLEICITDLPGQTVYTQRGRLYNSGTHRLELDLQHLKPGIYRLTLGNKELRTGKSLVITGN